MLDLFDRRDYWRRLWVVQEFALAPRVIFQCGWSLIENDYMYNFLALFWDDERGLSETPAHHKNTFTSSCKGP
jgi:hypothetical protein